MSFRFDDSSFQDNSFNEFMKLKLTKALNSRKKDSDKKNQKETQNDIDNPPTTDGRVKESKLDLLKKDVTVCKVDFPTTPHLEILDLDLCAQQPQSVAKSICKVSFKDALLQIKTEIEANALLLYTDASPSFTTPHITCNDSFPIPITITFTQIQLEAITNVFVKKNGVGLSFNDVSLDFKFDCSIKLLQPYLAKRLKKSMQSVFKDVLPSIIFNMSKSWFTNDQKKTTLNNKQKNSTNTSNNELTQMKNESNESEEKPKKKLLAKELDLSELSPINMLKLSTLTSSRQTLSLHSLTFNSLSSIPGCLDRQNYHLFDSKIPSLSTLNIEGDQENSNINNRIIKNKNYLPAEIVNSNDINLDGIIGIQNNLFDRVNNSEDCKPKRRKIKIKSSHSKRKVPDNTTTENNKKPTPTSPLHIDIGLGVHQMTLENSTFSDTLSPGNLKPTTPINISPLTNIDTSPLFKHETGFDLENEVDIDIDSDMFPPKKFINKMDYFIRKPELYKIHASFEDKDKKTLASNAIQNENINLTRIHSPGPSFPPFFEKSRGFSIVGLHNGSPLRNWGWSHEHHETNDSIKTNKFTTNDNIHDQPPPYS